MRDGYNKGVKTFPYSLEILNAKKAGQRALLSLLYKEKISEQKSYKPNKKLKKQNKKHANKKARNKSLLLICKIALFFREIISLKIVERSSRRTKKVSVYF